MRTSKITIDNQCQCDKQPESSGKTKSSVRILDAQTYEVVMDIVPPKMKFIQFCQISPSGRHLLVGNELGQFCYVYELYPPKQKRYGCKCLQTHRLLAVLFRGNTKTQIVDCSITQQSGQIYVMLNSSNATTHTYIIQDTSTQTEVQLLYQSHIKWHRKYAVTPSVITQFTSESKVVGYTSGNVLFEYDLVKGSQDLQESKEEQQIRQQVKSKQTVTYQDQGYRERQCLDVGVKDEVNQLQRWEKAARV